ncbi:Transcription accessory protein (S1 RNA-binding domain) [Chitinispirillum alkaliphilum]|nr:Transcription accessory protein (S1 RNA-binding domain) [Chitinispirillum alkaliphilum]
MFYFNASKNDSFNLPSKICCMIEYSKLVVEMWSIPESIAERICDAYQKGDSPYYLLEYVPQVSMELDSSTLWEIYDYLKGMEDLSAKKKRAINAFKKAGKLTTTVEKQINFSTKSYELDDLTISLRPNPRSRGQVAAKKGLDHLAAIIIDQQEEEKPVEDLASEYVGKHPSLKSVDDVIQGAKDIIAERFSFDETVRTMSRDFVYDDGFFEVVPKNKKDTSFSSYVNKLIPLKEVSKEELLRLFMAEDSKAIKLKVGVQLFRISELLRTHFVENPDSTSFDIICEAVDDMWGRLLYPIVERDIKEMLRSEAEAWAVKKVHSDLSQAYNTAEQNVSFFAYTSGKSVLVAALNSNGDLLGATSEKRTSAEKQAPSEKLNQFFQRHKPAEIVIVDGEGVEDAEKIISALNSKITNPPVVKNVKLDRKKNLPSESPWMEEKFGFLEDEARQLYALALLYTKPIVLVPELGADYYTVHPLQDVIPDERFVEIINRIVVSEKLKSGVNIKEIAGSPLSQLKPVSDDHLQLIKDSYAEGKVASKTDLQSIKGIDETVFRNIAGFIIIPSAENPLDRSTVHPEYFSLVAELSDQMNISIDTMISNPDSIKGYDAGEELLQFFIGNKLASQIANAQRFNGTGVQKIKRKQKLSELQEGAVVSGRVTNVTKFGVFVNINAVCDGLVHISQLADEYVETPEQVASVGDKVDVRILKVDVKKRRISLTMKNLGKKAPKIKPSKGQLNTLADFFKSR